MNARQAAATAPKATRTGRCLAVKVGGSCNCAAFAGNQVLRGDAWPTCSCGHTQAVHALIEVAAEAVAR